jgi:hypothetical protein
MNDSCHDAIIERNFFFFEGTGGARAPTDYILTKEKLRKVTKRKTKKQMKIKKQNKITKLQSSEPGRHSRHSIRTSSKQN